MPPLFRAYIPPLFFLRMLNFIVMKVSLSVVEHCSLRCIIVYTSVLLPLHDFIIWLCYTRPVCSASPAASSFFFLKDIVSTVFSRKLWLRFHPHSACYVALCSSSPWIVSTISCLFVYIFFLNFYMKSKSCRRCRLNPRDELEGATAPVHHWLEPALVFLPEDVDNPGCISMLQMDGAGCR